MPPVRASRTIAEADLAAQRTLRGEDALRLALDRVVDREVDVLPVLDRLDSTTSIVRPNGSRTIVLEPSDAGELLVELQLEARAGRGSRCRRSRRSPRRARAAGRRGAPRVEADPGDLLGLERLGLLGVGLAGEVDEPARLVGQQRIELPGVEVERLPDGDRRLARVDDLLRIRVDGRGALAEGELHADSIEDRPSPRRHVELVSAAGSWPGGRASAPSPPGARRRARTRRRRRPRRPRRGAGGAGSPSAPAATPRRAPAERRSEVSTGSASPYLVHRDRLDAPRGRAARAPPRDCRDARSARRARPSSSSAWTFSRRTATFSATIPASSVATRTIQTTLPRGRGRAAARAARGAAPGAAAVRGRLAAARRVRVAAWPSARSSPHRRPGAGAEAARGFCGGLGRRRAHGLARDEAKRRLLPADAHGKIGRARAAACLGGEEALDDAVLERVEADDGEPPAGAQRPESRRQRLLERLELLVDDDPERLEDALRRMPVAEAARRRDRAPHHLHEVGRALERLLGPAADDRAGDLAREALLAVAAEDVGQLSLARLVDDVLRRSLGAETSMRMSSGASAA